MDVAVVVGLADSGSMVDAAAAPRPNQCAQNGANDANDRGAKLDSGADIDVAVVARVAPVVAGSLSGDVQWGLCGGVRLW